MSLNFFYSKTKIYQIACLLFIANMTSYTLCAQQKGDIINDYKNYTELPREVAYVHLNKSTYIAGEMIGFKAYIFDKLTKEPSNLTKNLYCIIQNENGEIIKNKLIEVNNGVASNTFDIDSTLSSGVFIFKAYTNWMRNFDENNHFEQTFKVIDADKLDFIKRDILQNNDIELQALGEGGHIVYNINNTIGIIAKNKFGNGIANANGNITDKNGTLISEFQLNEVGLAKALFKPLPNNTYNLNLNLNDETITVPIENIKLFGINMTLSDLKEKINIVVKTNNETLKRTNEQSYKLAIHNGEDINVIPFTISEKGKAILTVQKKQLFSGTNIFTIFDNENRPLLERLYFNKNFSTQKISKTSVKQLNDSLNVSLSLSNLDLSKWSNLSVSVLPSKTKSYNHHNNLISQLYIQPYVKGSIENASQYFRSNDKRVDYNLDLLMLTQGWSSYNWQNIFKEKDKAITYPFEQGIDIVANINSKQKGTYYVYPMEGKSTQIFNVSESDNALILNSTFPIDNDLFRIGYLGDKKFKKESPKIYPQFSPSIIPKFKTNYKTIRSYFKTINQFNESPNITNAWETNDNVEALDEVTVNTSTKYTRAEALKNKTINSRVSIVNDNDRNGGLRLDIYLQRLGFQATFDYQSGRFSITNPRVRGIGTQNPVPAVYLDDGLIGFGPEADFGILTFITMSDIDYIEYELYGFGGGLLQGEAGFIKVYTLKDQGLKKTIKNTIRTYEIPLKFNEEKAFYTPKYKYYNTEFFNEYGTIAWEPKMTFNKKGEAQFHFFDTKTQNITLFVEGIVNGNQYISEEIIIETNN
ncbi:MAG: hypothetical protein AB8B52_06740 [Winogradskyella sp.]|uniref:hypothetical protein n=1 Tax=Winogradskyella sp. TaxID=1883156 RepID=UPI00385AC30E